MRRHLEFKDTALTVIADDSYVQTAFRAAVDARGEIESYILRDPLFRTTLEPHEPLRDAPTIVVRMCETSSMVGTGPMSAVAGAIALSAVETMVEDGASEAIVDNGGDIAMVTNRPLTVAIHTGTGMPIGLEVRPTDGVLGICTSSGRVGPSLSFGVSDACTVVSRDVMLADACATALGNMVRDDDAGKLRDAVRWATSIDGVLGAIVIAGGALAAMGDLPRIVAVDDDGSLITRVEEGA